MRQDRYRSFAELAEREREGIDYQVRSHRRESGVVVMAPHGGKIEPGTSEIAEAIADERFSFYAFEGIKRGHNTDLHIGSTRFDEPECLALMKDAQVVLSVHGLSDLKAEYVCVGGSHRELKGRLIDALRDAEFDARDEDSEEHRGAAAENLCNRSGPGVQFEISRALRERLKEGTTDLDEFASAVRSALLGFEKTRGAYNSL